MYEDWTLCRGQSLRRALNVLHILCVQHVLGKALAWRVLTKSQHG